MTAPSTLASTRAVRALLARYDLRAERGLGQNFLIDAHALDAIVAAAAPGVDDVVCEVGPGLGVLTRELARRAGRVLAVELDARLLPVLAETLAEFDNVTVIHGDALEFDFGRLPPGGLFVANLPYNVATPVVRRALEAGAFRRLVFLVQREVADRLTASPGTPAYGALSLLVQHFGRPETVRDVAPGSFWPAPTVWSSVVRIDTDPEARPEPQLVDFIHTAFRHRRKTLKKNLLMAGYARDAVEAALHDLGIDPRERAERLGLAPLRRLADALADARPSRPAG